MPSKKKHEHDIEDDLDEERSNIEKEDKEDRPDIEEENGDEKPVSPKIEVKSSDMSEEMQEEVIRVVTDAVDQFEMEKEIAKYVKKEFDKLHTGPWQCVCGKYFGSYITHDERHFMYLYAARISVLLFKSGPIAGEKTDM